MRFENTEVNKDFENVNTKRKGDMYVITQVIIPEKLTREQKKLFEETGIRAQEDEFEFLGSDRDRSAFYDFYCLRHYVKLDEIVLQEGETDGVMWASFGKIHWMMRTGKICKIIGHQFHKQEKELRLRNFNKFRR